MADIETEAPEAEDEPDEQTRRDHMSKERAARLESVARRAAREQRRRRRRATRRADEDLYRKTEQTSPAGRSGMSRRELLRILREG